MSTLFTIDVGWKVILDNFKIDVSHLLAVSGLPFDTFEKTSPKANAQQFFALWEELEKKLNSDDFSLLMGTSVSPEIFNPVIFSAICSQNFEKAMLRLQEFKLLIGPLRLCVDRTERDTLRLEVQSISGDELPLSYLLTECVFFVYLIQLSTREKLTPKFIGFPDLSYISQNTREYLNCQIEKAEHCFIEFELQDTQIPLISTNHKMWTFFEPQLQAELLNAKASQSFTEKVESILLKLIPAGQASIELVASQLCISKRTLQRKLKEEAVSFQEIVNRIREKLAKHYLKQTQLPNSQISFLLGFEDPNSFIRAFSNWVGKSPEVYRGANLSN